MGLLDMERASGGIHNSDVRDDHLTGEHRLDHVLRADLMHQRQREICRDFIDRFAGIRVQAIHKLPKQSLRNAFVRRPERSEKRRAVLRFVLGSLDGPALLLISGS